MAIDNVSEVRLFGGVNQTLTDALTSVTAKGKCEQSNTPSPDNPASIVCNNGTIGITANEANYVSSNVTLGYWLRNSDGQPEASGPNFYTAMMPVKPNTAYVAYGRNKNNDTLSNYNRIAWYDASGTWIRNSTYTQGTIGSDTSPSNAVYARFHCNINGTTATQELIDSYNWTFCEGTQEVDFVPYGITINGTTETLRDGIGNTAACDNLFAVGTYKDLHETVSGQVTRNTAILVLDGVTVGRKIGTAWNATYKRGSFAVSGMASTAHTENDSLCSHFPYSSSVYNAPTTPGFCTNNGTIFFSFITMGDINSANDANNWLAARYAEGNPVIVVYPLATATTETNSKSGLLRAPVIVTSGSLNDLVVNTSTGTRVIQRGTYANCPTITDVDCMHTPWTNNNMAYGFAYSTNLTSVVNIHNDVTNVCAAFRNCSSLSTTVYLPPSVADMQLAYADCNGFVNLANATLPYYATNMSGTFMNCRNMVTPPNLPLGVTNVANTFRNCSSLTSTPVIMPTAINRMDNTFTDCTSLTDVKTIPNSVDTLRYTFAGCGSLINGCTIPDSVAYMDYTFYKSNINDAGVANITWGNSIVLLNEVFSGCNSLYAPVINIPDSVTTIEDNFVGCYNLYDASQINLGNAQHLIETFQVCPNLRFAPNIPASAINVYHTLGSCPNLIGNVYVASHNITCAQDFYYGRVNGPTAYVNIHIPGEGTATYNSFISAGYTTNAAEPNKRYGVLLIPDMP